jgi:hypothetical protein
MVRIMILDNKNRYGRHESSQYIKQELKETNSTGDDIVAIRLGTNPMVKKVEYKRKDE